MCYAFCRALIVIMKDLESYLVGNGILLMGGENILEEAGAHSFTPHQRVIHLRKQSIPPY